MTILILVPVFRFYFLIFVLVEIISKWLELHIEFSFANNWSLGQEYLPSIGIFFDLGVFCVFDNKYTSKLFSASSSIAERMVGWLRYAWELPRSTLRCFLHF